MISRKNQTGVVSPSTLCRPSQSKWSRAGTGTLLEMRSASEVNRLSPPSVRMNGGMRRPATSRPQVSPTSAQMIEHQHHGPHLRAAVA